VKKREAEKRRRKGFPWLTSYPNLEHPIPLPIDKRGDVKKKRD
jgi:hypothetical protein